MHYRITKKHNSAYEIQTMEEFSTKLYAIFLLSLQMQEIKTCDIFIFFMNVHKNNSLARTATVYTALCVISSPPHANITRVGKGGTVKGCCNI